VTERAQANQTTFKTGLAAAAGVAVKYVRITKLKTISTPSRRRLLAEELRVETEVEVPRFAFVSFVTRFGPQSPLLLPDCLVFQFRALRLTQKTELNHNDVFSLQRYQGFRRAK